MQPLMIPAHFSQPPVNMGQPDIFNTPSLTLKWPICQSFQTHFNTERYYNTFRLYLFAVNMLEGHQPAGGVARYTTSLLRIMLCHMSKIK